MSIDKDDDRNYWFGCDGQPRCGQTFESELDDFAEAKDALKSEGWMILHINNDWNHLCEHHGKVYKANLSAARTKLMGNL